MDFANRISECIRGAIGAERAALHEPSFTGNELAYVSDCVRSGWVSSVGSYVDRFERDLASYTGARYAVAVVNGTSALHMALLLADVRPDDEVLVPALSFVASANAVRHAGAWPHFLDSEITTLGLSAAAMRAHLTEVSVMRQGVCFNMRTGRRIAAVVPMHTFGHPVNMPEVNRVAEDYGIPVVEDAAESLGSTLGGKHTGTFGLCAALSFNGNKIVTTGGGGAILTDDAALAQRAKHLTTTAKLPHAWAFRHDEVAYNYRLPNLNAALGCAQLEHLPDMLRAKRQLTIRYQHAFQDLPQVALFTEPSGANSNYWLQTLLLDYDVAHFRDQILEVTNGAGQMTRPAWDLLPTLPMYTDCECAPLPVACELVRRVISLPSSSHLLETR